MKRRGPTAGNDKPLGAARPLAFILEKPSPRTRPVSLSMSGDARSWCGPEKTIMTRPAKPTPSLGPAAKP